MNRVIKFRAWNEKNKIMYQPECDGLVIHLDGQQNSFDSEGDLKGTEYTKQLQLLQFTGLHDKNGVEVYEGDVLSIKIHSSWKPEDIIASGNEVVEYQSCSFGVKWGFRRDFTRLDGFAYTTFEVIGNIHGHPHLLEGAGHES